MEGSIAQARDTLKRVFGHHDFIGKQEEVIRQILSGGHAFVLMPTGGGKSLCYQIPALLLPGTAVVISPLIALMKDQVDNLHQYNVKAAYLNSSQSAKQAQAVKQRYLDGDLDLLYLAPERLGSGDGLAFLKQQNISLIAIDEAHCISQWGHDFRPDYLQLEKVARLFPAAPRVALTATADAQTRREIIDKLHLQEAQITIASFDRANIRYHIRSKDNTRRQFLEFYRRHHHGQSGIIYCLSRRRAEETAQWLETQNVAALPYHAGMSAATRQKHQEQFIHREGVIICATIAFGMGINKPDVRFVAHFDLPKSMEGYYQETGRAGRDGLPANAVLYYGLKDVITVRKLIDDGNLSDAVRRLEKNKLDALLAFCDSHRCRRAALLEYFGEPYSPPCDNCDNCRTPPQLEDSTTAAQKFLSAAARSRQRFGATHLIDILTGKKTEKVLKFSHHTLPTFGVGQELASAQWRRLAAQLLSQSFLQADEQYGALRLTDAGWELLRGQGKLYTKQPHKKQGAAPARTAREREPHPATALDESALAVFNALREERRRLAAAQNIPAYLVFNDAVLTALARAAPTSAEAFARVPGVGAAKAERYARAFIKIIKPLQP